MSTTDIVATCVVVTCVVVVIVVQLSAWSARRAAKLPPVQPLPPRRLIARQDGFGGICERDVFGRGPDLVVEEEDPEAVECDNCYRTLPAWFGERLPGVGWLCLHCERPDERYPMEGETEDQYVAERAVRRADSERRRAARAAELAEKLAAEKAKGPTDDES